jgi:hypothetical protein
MHVAEKGIAIVAMLQVRRETAARHRHAAEQERGSIFLDLSWDIRQLMFMCCFASVEAD